MRIERVENKMLVESEAQSLGHAKLRLLLDSGANSVALISRSSRELHLSGLEDWLGITAAGQAGIQVARVQTLMIGSQKFHDITAALMPPQASDAERIEDGLLPTALFRALYVNNRDGFVVLNPQAKGN